MLAHRAAAALGAFLAIAATTIGAAGAANAVVDPAPEGAIALQPRVAITALADLAPLQVTLDVPDGLEPVRLDGSIVPTEAGVGIVQVSQRGMLLAEADLAVDPDIEVPLEDAVVVDGELVLDVSYTVAPQTGDEVCIPPVSDTATLSDVTLWVSGEPSTPTTVSDFLAPGTDSVTVTVPDDATEAVVEAGLDAVGSVSTVLPQAGSIDLVPASELDVDDELARVIRIESGDGPVQTSFDDAASVPTLVLSGDEEDLGAAARALGSDLIPLADDGDTIALADNGKILEQLERPLSDFAGDDLTVSGYGENRSFTAIPEDAFGGPVSGVELQLVGSATRLPEQIVATAGVYWNDYLVDSFVLGDLSRFDRSISIPGDRLAASNTLVVRLSATPDFGACRAQTTILPVELHIDTEATTLTAERGQTLPASFPRFPQVLSGDLPVAFGGDGVTAETLGAAADIVSSMQRIAWNRLDVDVIPLDSFAADPRSGVVVGAVETDSSMLSAPLRLDEFRTVTTNDLEFGVGVDRAYAALQAFDQGGRTIVMLGSWSPDGASAPELESALGDWVGDQQYGWFGLFSDLIVTGSQRGEPEVLATNAVVPQEEVVESYRFEVWYIVAIVAVLILIGLIGWLVRRRRSARVRRVVEAQRAADSDALGRRRSQGE